MDNFDYTVLSVVADNLSAAHKYYSYNEAAREACSYLDTFGCAKVPDITVPQRAGYWLAQAVIFILSLSVTCALWNIISTKDKVERAGYRAQLTFLFKWNTGAILVLLLLEVLARFFLDDGIVLGLAGRAFVLLQWTVLLSLVMTSVVHMFLIAGMMKTIVFGALLFIAINAYAAAV